EHEWIEATDANAATVGITVHAQDALGDVVYVDLPEVGSHHAQGAVAGVVESVKAASDVYAPVSGKVVAVNNALVDKPETINEDAYGEGWMFTIEMEDPEQLNELLGPGDYAELIEEE
ncbi:glycine cleavage system protein GcvH, partial [Escherichia coli]|uniref:glycine cleavage system protein GcvH n=1 Tax=Escherichia coli TaxID=562 RepID=UPI00197DCAE7